jgi:hypothetical protein
VARLRRAIATRRAGVELWSEEGFVGRLCPAGATKSKHPQVDVHAHEAKKRVAGLASRRGRANYTANSVYWFRLPGGERGEPALR